MVLPTVKTAVIGCGTISHIYIHNLMSLFSIIDLAAVCDIRPEAAREKAAAYGVPRVMTLEEIAADPTIELVVCLTGPGQHYDVIRRMLLAGKHVFTEKTLAPTLEQAQELCALAQGKGLQLGVAPDTVLGAGIQTARKAVDCGLIGQVTSCVACVNRNQPLMAESFRFLRQNGGSLPYDVGIYYLSALLCLLGPATQVQAFTAPSPVHPKEFLYQADDAQDSWSIPGPGLMCGTLRFASGAIGSLHFSGITANTEQPVLRLYGTEGILDLGDPNRFDSPVTLLRDESAPCVLPFTHGYNGVPMLPEQTSFDRTYGHRGVGVAEMAWSLRKGRTCRLSGAYGCHALEILSGMERSAAEGRTIQVHSTFQMAALPAGHYSTMFGGVSRADAEVSLME